MESVLHTEWTVADICKRFYYDNYVYKEKRKEEIGW